MLVLVGTLAGLGLLVTGLQRTSGGGVLVAAGAGVLLCVVLFGLAVARVHSQDRRLSPAERASARATRYEQARGRRPAWMDSPWWAAFLLLVAAYWGWFAVAAARSGVLWLATLDALLCLAGLWGGVQVLRRRAGR